MKVKSGFVVHTVGGETVAVASGELAMEFNGMVKLKGTGAFLFELLQNDITEEELVTRLAEEYIVDVAIAKRDVRAFLASLENAGLIEQ